jgi:hypothetical protein
VGDRFDLVVIGDETEACLGAVAAARAGARVCLLAPPDTLLGGLLTEDGLAFVDRDSRHLTPPAQSPHDGIFAEFLQRANVSLVALEPIVGHATLGLMLAEASVTVIFASRWQPVIEDGFIIAVRLSPDVSLEAKFFLDCTPDGDFAEACGMRFAHGFGEYGIDRYLGVSPLPVVEGVTPVCIQETCERLARETALVGLKERLFGDRPFLPFDAAEDYVLVGPPYLGLAFARWRETQGSKCRHVFEADGFNVAVLGESRTSWNGLVYFCDDQEHLLTLSRNGCDDVFSREAILFERFLVDSLGWADARVQMPRGVYVRQTRHALDVRHRLGLVELANGYSRHSIGTFSYYPDFRGFRTVRVPGALHAHVILDAGICSTIPNLAIASRAAGYTPFAHSLCRLVQYNVTLATALGVSVTIAGRTFAEVDMPTLREELKKVGALADDPTGTGLQPKMVEGLLADALIAQEVATNRIA